MCCPDSIRSEKVVKLFVCDLAKSLAVCHMAENRTNEKRAREREKVERISYEWMKLKVFIK